MIDSFKFMAHVNRACNIKRRVKIREQLHPNYKHLCSWKVPITDMLFGDSIEERIRSQADANKMRDQLSKVNTGKSGENIQTVQLQFRWMIQQQLQWPFQLHLK